MARERVRHGGRSARIQEEVHRAVRELGAEVGRPVLTVPMIAERAGVTPSTIYRRWGDLSDLMADVAVQRLRPVAEPDDTGAADTDLQAFVAQYVEEMGSKLGRTLLRDILAGANESPAETSCRFTRIHLETLAARAVRRGETPFDVDTVIDRVIAPIAYHILFGDRPLEPAYVRGLLDGLA